jgi:transposase
MSTMAKRPRRKFTPEFKQQAAKLVIEDGQPIDRVARELDLTRSALAAWVQQARIDSGQGGSGELTTSERQEMAELRRKVRTLEMERDFLKKAAAFFARKDE